MLFKTIFLVLFLTLLQFTSRGQGNLEFNQVLTLTGDITMTSSSNFYSPIFTVPAGKVWKIEYIGSTATTRYGISINTRDAFLYLNGSGQNSPYSMPIWLKANDALRFFSSFNHTGTNQTINYVISIIEFNFVP